MRVCLCLYACMRVCVCVYVCVSVSLTHCVHRSWRQKSRVRSSPASCVKWRSTRRYTSVSPRRSPPAAAPLRRCVCVCVCVCVCMREKVLVCVRERECMQQVFPYFVFADPHRPLPANPQRHAGTAAPQACSVGRDVCDDTPVAPLAVLLRPHGRRGSGLARCHLGLASKNPTRPQLSRNIHVIRPCDYAPVDFLRVLSVVCIYLIAPTTSSVPGLISYSGRRTGKQIGSLPTRSPEKT